MKDCKLIILISLLCPCLLVGCKYIIKESVNETTEIVVEKSAINITKDVSTATIEKTLTKLASKNTINSLTLPVGKKSLEVLESSTFKGKFYPVLNNLGSLKERYPLEFNSKLLIERRKAISPYMQFLTEDNIKSINIKKLKLGYASDAKVLKSNMMVSMDESVYKINNAFGGAEAHHIVEGTDPSAILSRDILKQYNLDINDPINGILLPQDKNSIYKGTLHKTSHSKEYSEYVYETIRGVKTKEELIQKLNKIKYDLYNGRIKLEGNLHAVNKNDINI